MANPFIFFRRDLPVIFGKIGQDFPHPTIHPYTIPQARGIHGVRSSYTIFLHGPEYPTGAAR